MLLLLLTAQQETNRVLSSPSLCQAAATCPLPLPPGAHLTAARGPFSINAWEEESKHEDRNSGRSLQLVCRKLVVSSCRHLSCIPKWMRCIPFAILELTLRKSWVSKGSITHLLLKTTVKDTFCREKKIIRQCKAKFTFDFKVYQFLSTE